MTHSKVAIGKTGSGKKTHIIVGQNLNQTACGAGRCGIGTKHSSRVRIEHSNEITCERCLEKMNDPHWSELPAAVAQAKADFNIDQLFKLIWLVAADQNKKNMFAQMNSKPAAPGEFGSAFKAAIKAQK